MISVSAWEEIYRRHVVSEDIVAADTGYGIVCADTALSMVLDVGGRYQCMASGKVRGRMLAFVKHT